MAKDLKVLLAQKLAANGQRHTLAQQDMEFDVGRQHTKLPVDTIVPNPYQPRKVFPPDELDALATSIAESGLLQPISVRKVGDRYEIIAGERRWRAHKLLGKKSVEALVFPVDDRDMAVLALTENINREDLSDYEVGKALRQIESLFPSKKRLAEALGVNREDMYRYYAFEALPDAIRHRLDERPRLLSRSAAADLKRFVGQLEDVSSAIPLLMNAWGLLEEGKLEQTKLVPYMLNTMRSKNTDASKPEIVELSHGGRAVGSIKRDAKGIVIRLMTTAIDAQREAELRQFITQLLANREAVPNDTSQQRPS